MPRPTLRLVALVVAATLGVAACGGSGDDGAADGVAADGPGTTASGGDATGGAEVEFSEGFDGSPEACADLSSAFVAISLGPVATLFAGQEDVAEIRGQLEGRNFAAPTELEPAFATVEEAFAAISEAVGGATLDELMSDPDAMARVEEVAATYDTGEVDAALEEIAAFLEENCGSFEPGDPAP
jgi:hypothetical protein